MTEPPTVPPIVNRAMKFVLCSVMHGLISKSILLISFTGRKSGNPYTFPVGYSQEGDLITIFTHRNWWKNLRGGRQVTLRLRGQERQGLAVPVTDDKQAIAAALAAHLRIAPHNAGYYQVSMDENGHPNLAEVERAAQTVAMVSVTLC